MSFVLLAFLLAGIAAAIIWTPQPWKDDGDVTGLVWHTVRIPSALERETVWRDRVFLRLDAGEKIFHARIVLPESEILK